MSDHWILCVDDDEMLLSGLELQLGFDFDVAVATSGLAGLALLDERPSCAVIISDMRMPGMNGAEFLTKARLLSPDSTRMLLTGFSDVADTVSAVNDGGIFRFLTKPIPPESLIGSVEAGVRQWELLRSERVLLEETLHGAAQTLVEALAIAAPDTFARARRVEEGCRFVATELALDRVWEISLAGLLMRVGWIALPAEVIEARLSAQPLTAADEDMLAEALATTIRLVGRIPRLDGVAAIIAEAADGRVTPPGRSAAASVVRAVVDFDDARRRGVAGPKALDRMRPEHDVALVKALRRWPRSDDTGVLREIRLSQATIGMQVASDIVTPGGSLLVATGSELTETLVQRLRNFSRTHGVVEPLWVLVPPS